MYDSDDLVRPVASAVLAVLRWTLWFGVDIFLHTLGWGVGWCVCKAMTLGRYPAGDILNEDAYDFSQRLLVELIGLGVLGLLVLALAMALGA